MEDHSEAPHPFAKHRLHAPRVALVFERDEGPEDVANAILFHACDKARFITGQNLSVDSGWWMH